MTCKVIREKGHQFRCLACHQISHDDEITELRNEVAQLSLLISDLQSTKPSQEAMCLTPLCQGAMFLLLKDTFEATRKFNIVIFGIEECRQGAKRPERLAFDLSKVESVLVDIDGSLKSSSIKDCYRLGRYSADQEKPRPLLVKFVWIEDVSKVLANRRAAKSLIVVKPDMTQEERIRESTLLKHRWNLISSGVPNRAIKISRVKFFVNNVEYGTYSQSGLVFSSNRPVQNTHLSMVTLTTSALKPCPNQHP
jgi:hypothetical protein